MGVFHNRGMVTTGKLDKAPEHQTGAVCRIEKGHPEAPTSKIDQYGASFQPLVTGEVSDEKSNAYCSDEEIRRGFFQTWVGKWLLTLKSQGGNGKNRGRIIYNLVPLASLVLEWRRTSRNPEVPWVPWVPWVAWVPWVPWRRSCSKWWCISSPSTLDLVTMLTSWGMEMEWIWPWIYDFVRGFHTSNTHTHVRIYIYIYKYTIYIYICIINK